MSINMRRFERKLRRKFEKKQLLEKLKSEYNIEDVTLEKRMIQYSKILTTFILLFTIAVNAFYYFYIVPNTGKLEITDAAMQYSADVLKIWNAGTVIFFIGYFAKSLFETKFEKENSNADSLKEKIEDQMNIVLDNIAN